MTTAGSGTVTTATADSSKHPRPRPVLVLDHGKERTIRNKWKKHLHLHQAGILTISAYAKGNYNDPENPGNAGVTAQIFIDDELVAADMSFEGTSATIDFHATASHSVFLEHGPYELLVTREDNRINGPVELVVCYHVTAANTGHH